MKTVIFFFLFLIAIRIAPQHALLFLIACFFLNAVMTRYEYKHNDKTKSNNTKSKRAKDKNIVNSDNSK